MNNTETNSRKLPQLWEYLEANLPDYHTRDDVLRSDILFRYIDGDEVCEKDLAWIKNEYNNDTKSIKRELIRLENKFMTEAIKHFYEQI